MSTQIDSLQIKIESNSRDATAAIDQMTKALKQLRDAGGLGSIEKNIQKIATAVTKGLKNVPQQFKQSAKAADSFAKSTGNAAGSAEGFGSALSSATSNLVSFVGNAVGIYSVGQALAGALSEAREWDGISARFAEGFGDQVNEAYAHVMKLQEALYINDQAFMQYSSNFATLARGFGVTESAIADMSIGLTELAYDIYAKNNDFYTFEEAMNAVRSAIVGEVEPIRRAGISIMESTLKETAAANGITTSVENMTEAQKAMLRYKAMVDQAYASSTVGTYIQELGTVEGSSRALAQQLKGLAQTIGSVLMPIVAAVMPYIQAFVLLLTKAIAALGVVLTHQLYHMREGAVDSTLVNPKEPYDQAQKIGRRILEEVISVITGLLDAIHDYPRQGKCLRDVCQKLRKQRIATVRVYRVVEVNCDELRKRLILRPVQKGFIVDLTREVRILIVIDEHRESFGCELLDQWAVH